MMPDEPSLDALAAAAVEGDDAATAEFVRQTYQSVRALCIALGSHDDAEDLVQDTYLRALRSLPNYRGDAPLRAWLLAIARNTCADYVRRQQRRRRLLQRVRTTTTTDLPPPAGHTAELLAGIHPDRRDAFVLTQIHHLSYEEAAAALDCPVGTIRSRVARARVDLLAAELSTRAS